MTPLKSEDPTTVRCGDTTTAAAWSFSTSPIPFIVNLKSKAPFLYHPEAVSLAQEYDGAAKLPSGANNGKVVQAGQLMVVPLTTIGEVPVYKSVTSVPQSVRKVGAASGPVHGPANIVFAACVCNVGTNVPNDVIGDPVTTALYTVSSPVKPTDVTVPAGGTGLAGTGGVVHGTALVKSYVGFVCGIQ